MPTSARYISVNKCKNQPPKAVQPATKQSTGLFTVKSACTFEFRGFGAKSTLSVKPRVKIQSL